MDIRIRPADASEQDARAFVHYVNMTGDYGMHLLGRNWERIMVNVARHPICTKIRRVVSSWLLKPKKGFHYRTHFRKGLRGRQNPLRFL